MKHKIRIVNFRRRREGTTDYRKRLRILLSKKPRLIIRKSLNNISLQISQYDSKGDKIIIEAKATELKKYGWNAGTGNIPSAYLAGRLFAEKAKKAKLNECVLDIGFHKSVKGARIYAALKGVVDGELKVPCSEENFPSEERINGKHISDYAAKLKTENSELYSKTFANYLKKQAVPENVPDIFKKVQESLKGAR